MDKIKTTCTCCGGKVLPNMDKLLVVGGGMVLVAALAAVFGLPGGGWLALAGAVGAGQRSAHQLLRLKWKLLQESQKHALFACSGCGRDVPVTEIFDFGAAAPSTPPPR